MNFFEPSLNVPYQALFRKIQLKKRHCGRKRHMKGQSYPIYACIYGDHARYSSVHVTFRGSRKNSLLK